MNNVIDMNARRPSPPVAGATPVYTDGKHTGWLMPQVREYHNEATRRAVEKREK